ncbi:fumarylacetoacetate hydrolase family protein [bacterium]|nr:fumarylacetoacetate hydrolase family protein [bacterium]
MKKYARFSIDGGPSKYGLVENDVIIETDGDIFSSFKVTEKKYSIKNVKILAPCLPSKVVAVGLNYIDHAKELGMKVPDEPVLFMKPSTSVIGPDDNIIYPKMSRRVDYEAELAVVIKDKTKNIQPEEANAHIFGYTCLNDVTARDLQKKDGQWTRAKSFDTFCPIGPYIVTDINPDNLKIALFLNGQLKQSSTTSNLIFNVQKLVSFISKVMTLFPGDIIATGTPSGIGPLKRGDKVEVVIEKVGRLRNFVS